MLSVNGSLMDDTDEQRPNYSPFTTQSLPRTGPSHSTQPWKFIPHHLLSIGSSSAGIRYFSSSTRQLSRHNNPFTEDQQRDEEEDEEYDDEEHDNDEEAAAAATPKLTHVNQNGTAHMVSVGGKRATRRIAVAVASVRFSRPGPLRLIRANAVKKGDVLSVARIAGIMASKATPSVIPLCHTVNITHAEVEAGLVEPPPAPEDAAFDGSPEAWRERRRRAREERRQEEVGGEGEGEGEGEEELDRDFAALRRSTNARRYASSHFAPGDCRAVADRAAYPFGGVLLTARVETVGPTGVEMDALMAASAAALTVFDMCKAVDRAMRIENARVVLKTGGRSGDWVDAGWLYARAGVARRKELEGVMAWKGDLEAGVKDGKKWWKKCFRVLTRAGFDENKAQELLRWIKDGTMGVAGVKGEGEGGDEGGEGGGGGGEAVRVDEDEEPLWEGESDGGKIDFEDSTEKTSEESSLGKEQASQATEQPRNMPASSPVSTPQSTAETAAKKESRTKKPSLDASQTPQTTQQSPQDVPASSSQPARQSTLPAAAEQSPQPAPETSAPPALEEDPEYIEARNIAKVIAAVEERNEPLVLTPAMIRKMSATDIFADDELRSQKYRGMATEEAKNDSQPAAEEATPEDRAVALDFAIKSHQVLMVKKQMELERDAAEPSRQHATEEETDVDEDDDDDDAAAASTPPPPLSIHDLKKDRPNGSGRVLPTDIEPTPEEAALAQKSTAPPPWETMSPGPARVKAERQWRRDQEWNARMERLAALERRAEEARRRPQYSRHWLRARGGGRRMMRKVELAARIGVHDAEHDVLRWEPPGLDGGAEDEASNVDLRRSWGRFVKTELPPENSREKGVPRKYRMRHAVAREKEQLKRAMGRVDYNEWTLLTFIKGKRERRWDRERAVREEEEKSNEQAREALGLWDHLAGEDEFVEEENEGLEEGEERGRKELLEEAGRDYMEKWYQDIKKARG